MNDIVAMAMDSIRANKIRSVLTVLGVVIGVTTVIGMSAVISGLNTAISSQIEGLGSNLIFVSRFPIAVGRMDTEIRSRKKLTLEDAEAIAELPAVGAVAATLRRFGGGGGRGSYVVKYRDRTASNTIIEGVTADHENVFSLDLRAGRWISSSDQFRRANVVVLGYDTAETLFPNIETAVGRQVDLENKVFLVIGVLEKRRTGLGDGDNAEDNIAEIPVGAFEKLHPEIDDYFISLQPISQEAMPTAIDQVEGLMRRRRAVPYNKPNNFSVFTQDAFTDLWNQISGGIFAVMLAISSIALLVGGVGVMNIMLVSVTERTKEIGIRKAIGATQQKIMLQFLLEAMTLTALGGLIGIGAGGLLTVIVRTAAPFLPAAMSPFWVAAGFTTSVGTGLIFGLYPAYKAAKLDPIEALRYE